jgi:hypothetical protein
MPGGDEDVATIDLVGRDEQTGGYKLALTEYRPWDSAPDQLKQLVVKAGNYIQYVRDGQLVEDYPDAADQQVTIVIGFFEDPTPDAQHVLDQLVPQIKDHGIAVELVKYERDGDAYSS